MNERIQGGYEMDVVVRGNKHQPWLKSNMRSWVLPLLPQWKIASGHQGEDRVKLFPRGERQSKLRSIVSYASLAVEWNQVECKLRIKTVNSRMKVRGRSTRSE
jgi:hypothetical protein